MASCSTFSRFPHQHCHNSQCPASQKWLPKTQKPSLFGFWPVAFNSHISRCTHPHADFLPTNDYSSLWLAHLFWTTPTWIWTWIAETSQMTHQVDKAVVYIILWTNPMSQFKNKRDNKFPSCRKWKLSNLTTKMCNTRHNLMQEPTTHTNLLLIYSMSKIRQNLLQWLNTGTYVHVTPVDLRNWSCIAHQVPDFGPKIQRNPYFTEMSSIIVFEPWVEQQNWLKQMACIPPYFNKKSTCVPFPELPSPYKFPALQSNQPQCYTLASFPFTASGQYYSR